MEAVSVRATGPNQIVGSLSGGNQQKVSISKWLAAGCDILIIDEPTVGVDIGAKEYIHQLIWNLAKVQGKSIILISSDMPEIVSLARRILVFKNFAIVGEIDNLESDSVDYDPQQHGNRQVSGVGSAHRLDPGASLMAYTSYQRVLAALEHKEPDRVPIDLGGTAVTGINIHALRRLKDLLGIPGEVIIRDQVTQLAVTDDATFARLDLDVRCVGPRRPSNPGPARDHGLVDTHYRLTDEWGMGWQMPADGGHYYDLYHSPLAGAETVQDVENFPWPDPLDASALRGDARSGGSGRLRRAKSLHPGAHELGHVGTRHVDARLRAVLHRYAL